MTTSKMLFNEREVLRELHHYLPAQAPLKDFIHHNTLHAFQDLPFHHGVSRASTMFGYKVYLSLEHYKYLYRSNAINHAVLERVVEQHKGIGEKEAWLTTLLHKEFSGEIVSRIGLLRAEWGKQYKVNLDSYTHPILFRVLCSYLDQGVALWKFPINPKGFLATLQDIERNSFVSFFSSKTVREMFISGTYSIELLLNKIVGDRSYYKQYLFDQQFAHQGWSGMVGAIESNPSSLVDSRSITLKDAITFELFLELDAINQALGTEWRPLSEGIKNALPNLFAPTPISELDQVLQLWQEAYEWTLYDQVLHGIASTNTNKKQIPTPTMQAIFCIDDRECSLRRHIEEQDATIQTFGTAGFFNVEFYYKPAQSATLTKVCPAPITPTYLIKEINSTKVYKPDLHATKKTHTLFRGVLSSYVLGIWSAVRLAFTIFRPTELPSSALSSNHMSGDSSLVIECIDTSVRENGLQVGFTIEEMAARMEGLLKSIGLTEHFAPLVYIVGHGASSTNNTHYAGYDCGACSGRPGSVNARVAAFMLNNQRVRMLLQQRGITIPQTTTFIGALHDTTRDEIEYYDCNILSDQSAKQHERNKVQFGIALVHNSVERSRRFENVDSSKSKKSIHATVAKRSVSIFEPRPELNHATNALCVVGKRSLTEELFLDRRSFLQSYNYQLDSNGTYLANILKAVAPVCGGINLEYYFSRVDNDRLGAGTKLPHNIMGLIGVANGVDGDLRPGLPSQMIEVHDPVRLLVVVEHFPEIVLQVLHNDERTFEWFRNEWVRLAVVHPESGEIQVMRNGEFTPHIPVASELEQLQDIHSLSKSSSGNIPVKRRERVAV